MPLPNQIHQVRKKTITNNILDILEMENKIQKIKEDICKDVERIVADNRQFNDGEEVHVYLDGSFVNRGIVKSAKLNLRLNYSDLQKYVEPDQIYLLSLDRSLDAIFYEVFDVKSNGEASTRHFDRSEHFILGEAHKREGKYYISKIKYK